MPLYTHKCAHCVPSRQSCTFRGFPNSTEPDPTWHSTKTLSSAEQGRSWILGCAPALQSSMRTLEQPEAAFPVLYFPLCAGRLGNTSLRGELRGQWSRQGFVLSWVLCSALGIHWEGALHTSWFYFISCFPRPSLSAVQSLGSAKVLMEGQAGLCALAAPFSCMNSHIYAY